jgi:hypothetical protein
MNIRRANIDGNPELILNSRFVLDAKLQLDLLTRKLSNEILSLPWFFYFFYLIFLKELSWPQLCKISPF